MDAAVITRNRSHILARYALSGLLEIAESGTTVLLVDQSDDSRTEELVRGTAIKYQRTASKGLAAGRNVALRVVNAPWLVFTDDDMLPTVEWLNANRKAIAAFPEAAAVLGRGVFLDGQMMAGGVPGAHSWPADVFRLGSGYSFALARKAALSVGGFDPRFGAGAWLGAAEDTHMLYRLLRAGHYALCTDDVRISHPEWRSLADRAWRQFRYGRGTFALALMVFLEGDLAMAKHSWSRMQQQVRTVKRLVHSREFGDAATQACYLIGAASAIGSAMRLRRSADPIERVLD